MEHNPNLNPNRMMAASDGVDRSSIRYYERFHLNQFYNAVEDEQLYTDEYTNLLHSYNEFIVTGNTMFLRMEQALRANLDRSIVRQSFYYHRYSDIRRIRTPGETIYNFTPAAVPAPPAAHPPAAPPPAANPSTHSHPRNSRLGETFGRMLANYLTTEHNRSERHNADTLADAANAANAATPNTNLFSMLYTYTQPILAGAAAGAGAAIAARGGGGPSIPTTDQIRRATLNTTYSNIITPVNTTCPISRDEFEDDSEITMIRGCNHIFNRLSLREWFVNHSTCPMCRNDIRNYRSDAAAGPAGPAGPAVSNLFSRIMDNSLNFMNMEINNVTDDSVTFSYDLPNRYSDQDMLHDILNAASGASASNDNVGDPDDYMEVD